MTGQFDTNCIQIVYICQYDIFSVKQDEKDFETLKRPCNGNENIIYFSKGIKKLKRKYKAIFEYLPNIFTIFQANSTLLRLIWSDRQT